MRGQLWGYAFQIEKLSITFYTFSKSDRKKLKKNDSR
jgi:hypothetical protein